ncbi:uncharacterized protein DUF4397 [Chitinophaga niastensis]|uniref:Uncharacterized protein DUF4397 n=1 Tax=Chitinophaga niastensis TaxID=536980 RepID=A0A2P8HPD7_CHINA|nr:DUF4397 domain-containing protein [Chitinophaga niastensis]PSL48086.1 uncharacterized protein DUF4397 [Chitinophaga niastensis]
MLTKKNRVWAVVALLTGVIGFSSCLKNDTISTPPRPQASIWFLNTSTNGIGLDFYDNGTKVTSNSAIGFNFQARYSVYGGPHNFTFKKAGADSLVLSTPDYPYDSTKFYTFLLYDNPIKAATVYSDLSNYTQDKVYFRFLNLSKEAGLVDVFIGNTKVDSNRIFTPAFSSSFSPLPSLNMNGVVTIKRAGKDSVLVSNNKLKVTSFQQGNVYTVYMAGKPGSPAGDSLMVDAFYSYYN